MFVIGLVLGLIFGIITSILPGISGVITFLFITASGIDPQISLGFLIGSDCIQGALKQISICNPIGRVDDIYTNQAVTSFNKEESKRMASLAVMIYSLVKLIGLALGIILFILGGSKFLNVGIYFQLIALIIAALMWSKLIWNSKYKLYTLIIIISGAFLGWLVTKTTTNAMLITSSALIGLPQAIELVTHQIKKKDQQSYEYYQKESDVEKTIDLSAAFAGILSTLFYALPISALIEAFDNQEDSEKKIIQSAAADGASSSLGLMMVMSTGSARSAIASNIAITMPSFNIFSSIGILLLVALLTFAIFQMSPLLIDYLGSKSFNPKLIGLFSLSITTGLIIFMSSFIGAALIAVGILLNKVIKETESPVSCSLVPVSCVPLFSLIGI